MSELIQDLGHETLDITQTRVQKPFRRYLGGEAAFLFQPPSSSATVPLATSVAVLTKDEIERLPEWRSAFAGQYKDYRYYDIVENTLHPEFSHRYFVIKDVAGRVCGIQPFFILDQDILVGAKGAVAAAVKAVRKIWPRFLSLRTLMVGCIAGEGHLESPAAFEDPAAASLLSQAALKAARVHKAGLIVLKEFPAVYRMQLRHMLAHGFIRLPSLPMSSLSVAYQNFEDYSAKALSRATRKDLRRKFKAAQAADLAMTVVEDISPYIDEVYPLYLNVYNRSALHFEKLTKAYLCQLGQRMPDRTRYFIWRQEGRIVAFNLCMVHGDTIYDQYIGLDYTVALDLHLYHYTFKDIVSWAIKQGYRHYKTNGLNYDPKLHLKMQLEPLDLYVRHKSPVANAVMKVVLPLLEPTRYDKTLKKFANYSDLRGEI